jgi:hypothetical protein
MTSLGEINPLAEKGMDQSSNGQTGPKRTFVPIDRMSPFKKRTNELTERVALSGCHSSRAC